MSKFRKPLTLAHLLRESAKTPPEHGGPFRNERIFLAGSSNDPKTLSLRRAIADELAALAAKGVRFERPKGSKNAKSLVIADRVEELVSKNPTATHEELYQLAHDFKVIPTDMPRDTFKRYVTNVRRKLDIQSRAGRRPK